MPERMAFTRSQSDAGVDITSSITASSAMVRLASGTTARG